MSNEYNRYTQFPDNHVTVTPSDAVDLFDPMVICAGTTGNIAIVDKNDTVIVYTIATAPAILPVVAKRVNATGTTVTQVIGLY
jgi:hypothetical protein